MTDLTRVIQQRVDSIHSAGELTLLTAQCMTLLTASTARQKELGEQGHIQRFFKNICGKNGALIRAMTGDLATAQMAAQQMLQILDQRQLFTMNIVCALNQKINALQLQNERHLIQLQQLISHCYDRMEQLEAKVDQLETSVSVLQWERLANYKTLKLPELLITIANDFFRLTQGKWTNAHIVFCENVLYKYTTKNSTISYQEIAQEKSLLQQLFKQVRPLKVNDLIYLSTPMQDLYVGKKPKMTQSFAARDILHELLHTLVLIQQLTRPVQVEYQVIMAPLQYEKERIHVIRTLCLDGKLDKELSKELTWKQEPVLVKAFSSLDEAKALKKALEQNKCSVSIEEIELNL